MHGEYGVFIGLDVARASTSGRLGAEGQVAARRTAGNTPRPEAGELADANPRDRSVARWFGVCHVVGTAAMVWILVNLSLPALIGIGMWLVANLAALSVWSVAFWESIVATAYLLVVSALPAVLAVRERCLRRAGVLR